MSNFLCRLIGASMLILMIFFSITIITCGDNGTLRSLTFNAFTFNVQNLFDGEKNGNEYSEYTPTRWGDANYQKRLAAVGKALQTVSDGLTILALQEIENKQVVLDIQKYYLPKLPYVVVSNDAHASVQVGLLSKYKILRVTTHQLYQKIAYGTRPLLSVLVKIPQVAPRILQVIVVHLKSQRKMKGQYSSSDIRNMQYRILSTIIDPDNPTIILGDFNDTDPLPSISAYISAMPDNSAVQLIESPLVKDSDMNITGTYFYQNHFQHIDHIMIDAVFNTYLQDSMVHIIAQAPFLTDKQRPNKFVYHRKNYTAVSDHLPLAFTAHIKD